LSVVKTDIWMPVFIGDYLADTMHLSTEQHGAYLLLLFHLWRRGSLRDDDAVLAKISGLGESAWNLQRPVLAEFFKIHDGLWQHGRVEKEKARVAATKQSKVKKAKLAASSRWSKGDASSIAQAMLGDADSDSDSDSDLKAMLPQRPEEEPQVPPLRSCGAPVGMTNLFGQEKGPSELVPPLRSCGAPVGMTNLFGQEKGPSELVPPLRSCGAPVGMTNLFGQEKGPSGLQPFSSQEKAFSELVPPLRSCGAPVGMTDLFGQEKGPSGLQPFSSREKASSELVPPLRCAPVGMTSLFEQEGFSSSRKKLAVCDPRHGPFRAILAQYWRAKNHASPEMPWQGRDAKALSNFLAACPRLNETQFRQMVGNRARSAVAHGDRVYLWISNLTRFQEEITVYNKPASAGGGHASRAEINRNSVVSAVDGALMLAQEHADRVGQTGAEPAGFNDPGVPAADGPGPGRCAVALPGNGDHGVAAGHSAYGQTGTDGPLPYRAAVTTASQVDRDGRQEVRAW
jgi:uncharacterized protein YdaU (DUF1376 family)